MTWGDTIFSGFPKDPKEITRRRDEQILREVGYILQNHHITPRRLVMIIEAGHPKSKKGSTNAPSN